MEGKCIIDCGGGLNYDAVNKGGGASLALNCPTMQLPVT